jgi:hypothetical protein
MRSFPQLELNFEIETISIRVEIYLDTSMRHRQIYVKPLTGMFSAQIYHLKLKLKKLGGKFTQA